MNVTGFVDGVSGGRLRGWVANLATPHLPEPFMITTGRAKQIFLAVDYRADVCEHLGLQGRFGFSVDIALLEARSGRINVVDMTGSPLERGKELQISNPAASGAIRPNHPTRIYLHIQKTGGTSLQQDVKASYSDDNILFVYPSFEHGVAEEVVGQIPKCQLATYDLIFGHLRYGVHHHVEGAVQYVTTLRDPVDRLRSQVWHLIRIEAQGKLPCPIGVLANEGRSDELDNLMVRTLAGVTPDDVSPGQVDKDILCLALANLREAFAFVSLLRSGPNHYNKLLAALGALSHPRSVLNKAPPQERWQIASALSIDWAGLIHRNRFDIQLYQAVLAERLHDRRLR